MSFETITSRALKPGQLPNFVPESETVHYHGTQFRITAPSQAHHVTIAHLKNVPGGLEIARHSIMDQPETAERHLMIKTDRLSYVGQSLGRVSLALVLDDSDAFLEREARALHTKLGRKMESFLPHVTVATLRWSGNDNPERPPSEMLNRSLGRFIPPVLRLDPARTLVRLNADEDDQTAEAV